MRPSARVAIVCGSAIRNSGFDFPHHRITVNLAPADVRKAGSSFDLPIALGLLATSGPLTRRRRRGHPVLGELSLDGGINASAACCRLLSPRDASVSRVCCCLLRMRPKRASSMV